MATTIALYAHYTASKAGKTGLIDVTIDIIRITRSDGTAYSRSSLRARAQRLATACMSIAWPQPT